GEFQQRVTGAPLAERIEVGEEVAEVAIGVDEADDANLLGSAAGGRWTRQAKVESLEEVAPTGIDRFGVLAPALVGGFDGFQGGSGGDCTVAHDDRVPVGFRACTRVRDRPVLGSYLYSRRHPWQKQGQGHAAGKRGRLPAA